MRDVIGCGYLGLVCPDLNAWREFAGALGAVTVDSADGNRVYVRIDDRAYRLCVERGEIGPSNGVSYVGWEVANNAALDSLAARLRDAGHLAVEDPNLARDRNVDRLIVSEDTGGNRLEFFVTPFVPREQFVSPMGVRFVTRTTAGQEMGLGHVVTTYNDADAASRFYIDLLGFSISDYCLIPDRWIFAHVNPRHHSLAFAQYENAGAFHHFMLEMEDLEMVGKCHDRLIRLGAPFTTTFGKHNNDLMTSFYVRTPSGIEVEIGCDGRLIDDDNWTITTLEGAEIWGHHRVPG